MRKAAAILGFVLSGIVFMTGILTMSGAIDSLDFDGDTASYSSFSGAFNNYSYRATRYAANNVAELGELVQQVSGLAMFFVGAAGAILSLFGLGTVMADEERCMLLKEILRAKETVVEKPVPEKPTRTPVAPPQRKYPEDKSMRIPVMQEWGKNTKNGPATVAAVLSGNGWFCLCGATNPQNVSQCTKCGRDRPRKL